MKKRILPFIILFIAAFALSSCILNVVEPGGEYISKEYHVRSFENISVSAGMELLLTQKLMKALLITLMSKWQTILFF